MPFAEVAVEATAQPSPGWLVPVCAFGLLTLIALAIAVVQRRGLFPADSGPFRMPDTPSRRWLRRQPGYWVVSVVCGLLFGSPLLIFPLGGWQWDWLIWCCYVLGLGLHWIFNIRMRRRWRRGMQPLPC